MYLRFYRPLTMIAALALAAPLAAATLEVGPGKPFARLEAAVAHAQPGDVVMVFPSAGKAYEKVALQIKTPHLTIRAANPALKIDGTGFDYSGRRSIPRAIVEFGPGADGGLLEGFELTGAHNDSCNGAGVRINQANDVTVRHCKIHDNDMGIMSNGSFAAHTASGQLIEGCTITSNGNEKQAGYNHNLYLGGSSVTVRACEISHSLTGHNLKSRAHFNWIEYNYIHDSDNRELDLVDEKGNTDAPDSHTVLLGNTIIKSPHMSGNKTTIHFGQDGGHDHAGTLYMVFNTIISPYGSPIVDLSAAGTTAVFINNKVSDHNAHQAGLLVATRNGAVLAGVTGKGNDLAPAFGAKLPPTISAGEPQPWSSIDLPWPAGTTRPPLQEFLETGKLVPRQQTAAGAGTRLHG